MSMESSGDNWVQSAIAAGLGSAATGLVTFLRTRKSVKADIQKTLVDAAQEASHLAVQDVVTALGVQRTQMVAMKTQIVSLRDEMAKERKLCDSKIAEQQAQIDLLMKGIVVSNDSRGNSR